jgi:tetratricopeptide (TPR) repeat protein
VSTGLVAVRRSGPGKADESSMDEHTKQWLLLGREHYQKREFDKAEPMLRQVLESSDRMADVHDMLGVICHTRGNFAQAEYHFERALAINPSYTEAALNLAVTYNDRGKYEAARQVYSRIRGAAAGSAYGLDPFARGKIANMHAEVAQAYADAGLVYDAIGEFEKAVRLCPDFADLRTRLGTLLREVNDLPRAREEYEAAIHTRPSYVPARVQLGVTLLSLGEADAADAQWRKVLEIEPENVRAKMYLRMTAAARAESVRPPGTGSRG